MNLQRQQLQQQQYPSHQQPGEAPRSFPQPAHIAHQYHHPHPPLQPGFQSLYSHPQHQVQPPYIPQSSQALQSAYNVALPATNAPAPTLKRPRACESCRGLKVRCQPDDPQNPKGPCRRCTKAKRTCVFTEPTRKRHKKVDSKVAELERKIDALTASLRATKRARELGLEDDEDDEEDDGDMDVDVDLYVDVDEHTPESEPATGRGTEDLSPEFGTGGLSRKRDHANISVSEHMDEDDSTVSDGSPHSTSDQRSRRLGSESVKRASGPNRRSGASAQGGDVIDQGLLDMGTARALWRHYNDNIVRIFPAVSFKPKDTMDSIRKKKPTLFLAIMAAASGITHPELYNALHQEITRMFAEKIMMNGEKSLELVQALTLMSLWYRPPGRFEELKFYMLIHMSVAMALDIGLGKKLPASHPQVQARMASASRVIDGGCRTYKDSISDAFKSLSTGDKSSLPKPPIPPPSAIPWEVPPKIVSRIPSYLPDPCTIESRRAFLACYVSASQVSVALRRPNILRFNNFMDESLVILETSPDASEHDRIFCQYVHLQRIAEEMAELFAFDDPMARINIKDPTIQHAMKRYGLNLESWRARVKPEYFTPALKLYYHATVLLCHEVALHRNHNVDDFRMPFTERIVAESSLPSDDSPPSVQIAAISTCVKAAQSYLDVLCSFPISDLLLLPILNFVRTSYCCMILTKIFFTVSTQSDLGRIIEPESLKVEDYLNRTVLKLAQAVDGEKSSPAGKFAMVLITVKRWYHDQKDALASRTPEDVGGASVYATPAMSLTAHSEHAFLHTGSDATTETSISEPHPAQPPTHAQSGYSAHVEIPPSPSPGDRQPRLEPNDLSESFVEPQHEALPQSHEQHGAENMESTEESVPWPTHLLNPNTHWVANVQGGMVEFEAGELGLGLGGQGREFFMDDSFWRGVEWMYM